MMIIRILNLLRIPDWKKWLIPLPNIWPGTFFSLLMEFWPMNRTIRWDCYAQRLKFWGENYNMYLEWPGSTDCITRKMGELEWDLVPPAGSDLLTALLLTGPSGLDWWPEEGTDSLLFWEWSSLHSPILPNCLVFLDILMISDLQNFEIL